MMLQAAEKLETQRRLAKLIQEELPRAGIEIRFLKRVEILAVALVRRGVTLTGAPT